MKNPFYSIIMPVWNTAMYLPNTLQSLQQQKFEDWECLCIDDGSNDQSINIIKEITDIDTRFKLFQQPHNGVAAARNLGLTNAQGKWIVFFDSDDLLSSEMLFQCHNAIKKHPNADGFTFEATAFTDKLPNFTPHDIVSTWKKYTLIRSEPLPPHFLCRTFWQFIFRRSIATSKFFHPFIYGDDRLFMHECLLSSYQIWETKQILYGYRIRPKSLTTSFCSEKKLEDSFDANFEIFHLFTSLKRPLASSSRRALYSSLLERPRWLWATAPNSQWKKDFYKKWRSIFKELRNSTYCSPWYWCTLTILLILPYQWIESLLLSYIYGLKLLRRRMDRPPIFKQNASDYIQK